MTTVHNNDLTTYRVLLNFISESLQSVSRLVTEGRSNLELSLPLTTLFVPELVDIEVRSRVKELLVVDALLNTLFSVVSDSHVPCTAHRMRLTCQYLRLGEAPWRRLTCGAPTHRGNTVVEGTWTGGHRCKFHPTHPYRVVDRATGRGQVR